MAFQIPTIEQVREYIQYKQPSWPEGFVEYISEKFWHNYQSNGWRLSNNIAMKDWKSAFCARWQHVPFEEDRKKLQEFRKSSVSIPTKSNLVSTDKTLSYVDDLMGQFRSGSYDWHDLSTPYKWLMENKIMSFTKAEIEKLVADAGNNKEYGRYLAVKMFFSKLLAENLTFSEYINKRKTA